LNAWWNYKKSARGSASLQFLATYWFQVQALEVLPHTPLGMQSLVSLGTANKQQDGRAPLNPKNGSHVHKSSRLSSRRPVGLSYVQMPYCPVGDWRVYSTFQFQFGFVLTQGIHWNLFQIAAMVAPFHFQFPAIFPIASLPWT
jgi:hypothetical protein